MTVWKGRRRLCNLVGADPFPTSFICQTRLAELKITLLAPSLFSVPCRRNVEGQRWSWFLRCPCQTKPVWTLRFVQATASLFDPCSLRTKLSSHEWIIFPFCMKLHQHFFFRRPPLATANSPINYLLVTMPILSSQFCIQGCPNKENN